jgi:hypothetical protein
MAHVDHAARSRKGWANGHRAPRIAGLKAGWADPEQRARRRAAIARAMRDIETRSTLSNSRSLSNALKALAPLTAMPWPVVHHPDNIGRAGEVVAHAAYEVALAATSAALGLSIKQARAGNAATAAGQARALASYLAVTFFRVAVRQLAAARDIDRRGLRRVIADCETRRDDPVFEAQLRAIERSLAQ